MGCVARQLAVLKMPVVTPPLVLSVAWPMVVPHRRRRRYRPGCRFRVLTVIVAVRSRFGQHGRVGRRADRGRGVGFVDRLPALSVPVLPVKLLSPW